MAIELKQLVQLDQSGDFIFSTDKTGEYDAALNDTGWGSPNRDLFASALMVIIRLNNNPVEYLNPVDTQIKFSAAIGNDTEYQWQFDYNNDGYHSAYMLKIYVSADDQFSLDSPTPVEFVDGDIWWNHIEGVLKELVLGVPTVIDLTDQAVDNFDKLIKDTQSIEASILCEDNYYTKLAIRKNRDYYDMRLARKEENEKQVQELRINQMDILLGTASADYNFNGGLKMEGHDIIESLLDDNQLK